MTVAALGDIRVVDLSLSIAGAETARILAGLGADVVKVETPGDADPLRSLGARLGDITTAFAAHNADKRSILLDLDAAGGRAELDALLAAADVLIESADPRQRERWKIDVQSVKLRHPHLVHATVTPFGLDGPCATWVADDLVLSALGGHMSLQGTIDGGPLASGIDAVSLHSANTTAIAVCAALLARDRDRYGQHVEVAGLEVATSMQLFDTVAFGYLGVERKRRANHVEEPWAVLPTKDGHVAVARSALIAWEELWLPVFGEDVPAWVLDPTADVDPQEVRASLAHLISGRETREFVELCQMLGHIVGEVLTIEGVLESPQHAAREFFDTVEYDGTSVRVPGPPARLPATPWRRSADGARPAPARGAHTNQVRSEWSEPRPAPAGEPDARPVLDGVRVLDFTMGWAGPFATELFADFGADVVKVESIGRTDWWRTARRMFTGPVEDPDWLWEMSPLWNSINESKRGITLDLSDDTCRQIARRLVATADIVVENFTPRVMKSFGLDYDAVRAINPNVIMVSMPGFGSDGPWHSYRSTALVAEAMAGVAGRCGYADGPPQVIQMSPADPNAGIVAAWSALAALRAQRHGAGGQHIEVAQVEAATHFLTWELLEAQVTGIEPPRRNNSTPGAVLSGCRETADGWVSFTVRDERDVAALDRLTGGRTMVDMEAFLSTRPAREAAEQLQAAGIPAGDVRSARLVREDPQLAHRGFFHETERIHVGRQRYPSAPLRLDRSQLLARKPAPTLGADTRAVLTQWIGMPDAEIDALFDYGVAGTEPRGTRHGVMVS